MPVLVESVETLDALAGFEVVAVTDSHLVLVPFVSGHGAANSALWACSKIGLRNWTDW